MKFRNCFDEGGAVYQQIQRPIFYGFLAYVSADGSFSASRLIIYGQPEKKQSLFALTDKKNFCTFLKSPLFSALPPYPPPPPVQSNSKKSNKKKKKNLASVFIMSLNQIKHKNRYLVVYPSSLFLSCCTNFISGQAKKR